MKSFVTDVFSVGISKVIMIFAGLVTSILVARNIGPEGNGIIAAITVYPSLFMNIGSLGIRQSATFLIGKQIFPEHEIKKAVMQVWFFTTAISVLVSYLLIKFFSNSGSNNLFVLLAILAIPFTLFNTYNSGIFLGKNQIKAFNRINWVPSVVVLTVTIGLVWLFKLGIAGYLTASVCGPLFISIILLFKNKLFSYLSFSINKAIVLKLLSLGIVYATSLLVINLNYKADVILLDKLNGAYETGIYSKGSAITQYLWQIPMFISTIIFARSANAKDDRLFSLKVAQLLRVSLVLIGIGSLVLLALSRVIIVGMYGEAFANSSEVLNYLLPGVLLLTIFKVMNMDLAGKGKPWVSMKAMVPALIVNIALNIYWIPAYGANGAALASTISYSMAALLFLKFYSTEAGISIKEILTYKKDDFKPILKALKVKK
mgnify:CR=1 FL=1